MATTTPLPPPSGVLPPLPDDIVILIALATPRKHLRPFFRLNRRIRDTLWSASFIGGHYKAHSTEVEQVEALAAATGRGDARVVRALLLYGALGAPGTRAFGLRYAAATVDAPLLRELLDTGAGGRVGEPGGELALGNAAAAGRLANVAALLDAGADVAAAGGGALTAAVLGRHAPVVRALVLAGGDAEAAAGAAAARGCPSTAPRERPRPCRRRAAGTDRLACVWAPCCSLVCFFSFLCYCFHTPACRPCTACAA